MDVLQLPNCLELNDNQILNDEVESMFSDLVILVKERDSLLPNKSDAIMSELNRQSFLVD